MEIVTNTPAWAEENFKAIDGGGSFYPVRADAFKHFSSLGLPTTANEEWKYTNVSSLAKMSFKLAGRGSVDAQSIAPFLPAGLSTHKVVFVNGAWSAELSDMGDLPRGLSIESLKTSWSESSKLAPLVQANLAKHAAYSDHPFVALNTAFVTDGAVIRIEKGAVIDSPVHIVHVSTAEKGELITTPRVLVVVEANAVGTLIESFVSFSAAATMTTAVTEIVAGENAEFDHYKLVEEGPEAYHLGTVQVSEATRARVRTSTFSLGGKLVRNEVNATLQGEDAFAGMFGLSVLNGAQHVDNHTVLDHAKPRCESRELYKGIYADTSSGVFNGTIIVRPDAQKTNAFQSNRALLLSEDASIDSKPQLKIWADDVKCTHGATVGQLDEDGMFYLRSRGIPYDTARAMLVHAFASEVVNEVRVAPLKSYLETRLLEKLAQPGT